ncbi:hypothetical protein V8F33_000732 [Rhypophila sp. PSN 637]
MAIYVCIGLVPHRQIFRSSSFLLFDQPTNQMRQCHWRFQWNCPHDDAKPASPSGDLPPTSVGSELAFLTVMGREQAVEKKNKSEKTSKSDQASPRNGPQNKNVVAVLGKLVGVPRNILPSAALGGPVTAGINYPAIEADGCPRFSDLRVGSWLGDVHGNGYNAKIWDNASRILYRAVASTGFPHLDIFLPLVRCRGWRWKDLGEDMIYNINVNSVWRRQTCRSDLSTAGKTRLMVLMPCGNEITDAMHGPWTALAITKASIPGTWVGAGVGKYHAVKMGMDQRLFASTCTHFYLHVVKPNLQSRRPGYHGNQLWST